MKRMIACAAVGLALAMVLQATATTGPSAPVGPVHPVLSYTFWGNATMVINLADGAAEYWDSGWGTHVGKEENHAIGYLDLTTLSFYGVEGVVTAASGDQIFYDASGPLGGDLLVTITGGTGRFEDVSGELTSWVYRNVVQAQEGYILTITYSYTATGWISY
jgi:hypothetical protein